MTWWRRARGGGLVLAALALALFGAAVVLFAPLWSWDDSEGGSGSANLLGQIRAGEEDFAPVVLLAFAALLPLLALIALGTRIDAPTRWVTAVLLLVFCFLGAMSVGMFMLPAALALFGAALAGTGGGAGEGAASARTG